MEGKDRRTQDRVSLERSITSLRTTVQYAQDRQLGDHPRTGSEAVILTNTYIAEAVLLLAEAVLATKG